MGSLNSHWLTTFVVLLFATACKHPCLPHWNWQSRGFALSSSPHIAFFVTAKSHQVIQRRDAYARRALLRARDLAAPWQSSRCCRSLIAAVAQNVDPRTTMAAYSCRGARRNSCLRGGLANDAPNVSIGNALADTRGNAIYTSSRHFSAVFRLPSRSRCRFSSCLFLPIAARLFAIYLLLTVTAFIGVTLGSCIAARIYQAMGNRLNEARA